MQITDHITYLEKEADEITVQIEAKQRQIDLLKASIDVEKGKLKVIQKGIQKFKEQNEKATI